MSGSKIGVITLSIVFSAAGIVDAEVYRPDSRSQIEDLGTIVVLDGKGIPHTVRSRRISKLMCPAVIRDFGGIDRIVGAGVKPLPPNIFDEAPDDPGAIILNIGGGIGRGNAVATGNLAFEVTVSGSPGTHATDAIERCCFRYIDLFDDNVTVRLKIIFESMSNPSAIGSTSVKTNKYSYDDTRSALISDADPDDTLHSSLPNSPIEVIYKNSNVTNEKKIYMTHAVAKAAGLRSAHHSNNDGTLTFNTDFDFDYDPSNGIDRNSKDFEHTLTHEIGHILGFISSVDGDKNDIYPIDMFRFRNSDCATNSTNFGTRDRTAGKRKQGTECPSCLPGWTTAPMSTGLNNGDGRQASHWKDDTIIGTWIGMMDPTLQNGAAFESMGEIFTEYLTNPDLRAFDFIGWDYEPIDTSLGTFNLVSPANTSTGVSPTVTLNWTNASNAFDYHLTVHRDVSTGKAPFTELTVDINTAGLSYAIPAGTLLLNTTYSWFVVARTINSYTTRGSGTWSFTVDSLLTQIPGAFPLFFPLHFEVGLPRTPILDWQNNTGSDEASSYTVEIDDELDFDPPEVWSDVGLLPELVPPYLVPPRILLNNQTYYWRVTGYNSEGQRVGTPTTGRSFTTGIFPPDPFGLLTPAADVDEISPLVAFTWQPAWEAETYTLQVDDDPGFGSPEINHVTSGTSYEPPPGLLQPLVNYAWRVFADNGAGTTGSIPPFMTFTTSPPPPAAFAKLAPGDGATTPTTVPTLSWSASADANEYLVEVDDDPDMDDPEVFVVTSALSLEVPAAKLNPGGDYYWQVTAVNPASYTDADSKPFALTISADAPAIPAVSTWGLWVLALTLLSSATVLFRRRGAVVS